MEQLGLKPGGYLGHCHLRQQCYLLCHSAIPQIDLFMEKERKREIQKVVHTMSTRANEEQMQNDTSSMSVYKEF